MARLQSRPRATAAEIGATIQELRAYHRTGQDVLEALAQQTHRGEGVIRELAEELGWNETKTRKARQFADPRRGYNEKRLETLCRLLRNDRPIFGTAHVGILITASWSEGRAELQRLCIANNWSKAELEAEVLRRLGPRRHGGRRRAVVADRGHLLVQLEREADSWRRWFVAAERVQHDDGKEVRALDKLPADVRDRVLATNRAMRQLREVVSRRLGSFRTKLRKRATR